MKLKLFAKEILSDWKDLLAQNRKVVALAGAVSPIIGEAGESFVLRKLKKKFPDYEFIKTEASKSPADIIGLMRNKSYLHFALFQVKASKDVSTLTKDIPEKDTLPILAEIIKSRFITSDATKYYKKRALFITMGYVGVHISNKSQIVQSLPYPKTFSLNKLELMSSEKTLLKNIHRNIK